MTAAKKKPARGAPRASNKPRGVSRRPASRVAKLAATKKSTPRKANPTVNSSKKATTAAARARRKNLARQRARKTNPSKRYFVVTGGGKGFASQAEAVKYAQRFADRYGVSLDVVTV